MIITLCYLLAKSAMRDSLDQYLVSVSELEYKTGEKIPVADYAKYGKPPQSRMIPLGCDKSEKTE
jgi:endonuclease G